MEADLIVQSQAAWEGIASRADPPFPLSVALERLDFRKPELELGTDDFFLLMGAFADEVGVDLATLGKLTWLHARNDNSFRFFAAVALRSVFEVEGYYVEIEGAYALFKVPRKLLIVMGAVLIGMATGKAYQLDPILAGAVGGVGNLLINILAARYSEPEKILKTTWAEELVLSLLRDSGEKSLKQLQDLTRLHKQKLKETLAGLLEKQLVESLLLPSQKGEVRAPIPRGRWI